MLYTSNTNPAKLHLILRSMTPVFKGTGPVAPLSGSGDAEMDARERWAVKSALSLSLSRLTTYNTSLENFTGSAFNNNLPAAGYPYEQFQ